MTKITRYVLVFGVLGATAATARAQQPPLPPPTAPAPDIPDGNNPTPAPDGSADKSAQAKKQPKRGDFDAGGRVRLPSGPDDMGKFATFNWVAVDLHGQYNLLDTLVVRGDIPVALIKPSSAGMGGPKPSTIGGFGLTLDAKLPKGPFMPKKYEATVRLLVSGAFMREGAMLLSEKDFPLFTGKFQPGFTAGVYTRVKMSSFVDFSFAPVYVQQATSGDSLMAVQIPLSLIIKTGSVLTVSADAGIFTGDGVSFSGDDGGRIAAGGSLTIKIGSILVHAGAGVASLLTGGLYPTIRDSIYVDLNVKYAK